MGVTGLNRFHLLFVCTAVSCWYQVAAPEITEVRLVNGSSEAEGRVEVLYGGSWMTVCGGSGWDLLAARVVCRMLGHDGALDAPRSARFGQGTGDILYIDCFGSEDSLADCFTWVDSSCEHHMDVGAMCYSGAHPEPFQVRLVSGSNDAEGRVEVLQDGSWGNVCHDGWDLRDARVVCRMLGFGGALDAPRSARFGQGSGRILLTYVKCDGTEDNLADCAHPGIGDYNYCDHRRDTGVICYSGAHPNPFQVRLIGGSNDAEGRVEVIYDGSWGTICDTLWDLRDARVVCRMLGFDGALDAPGSARFGQGSVRILLNLVNCDGTEDNLADCARQGIRDYNYCSHGRDAGVICYSGAHPNSESVRLVGGSKSSEGRVEISYNGTWGTVCDDGWDLNDAKVVCRMLGFGDASAAPGSAQFGEGSDEILLSLVGCDGTEDNLADCAHLGFGVHNCQHKEDAGVTCLLGEPPVGLTLINENEGTAINSSFLKVRADVNTTIRCLANTSVYLQLYPNCSDPSYHACREGDPHNVSRALSFTPRASQNGTILTCRIENTDEATENINTSITLQVEVCVQHLAIVRNNSLRSTVDGESAWRCETNTRNFNLTSSSLFFNTSYQDGRGNEHLIASWETAGALHLASYKLDSNFSSLSCCVSMTSVCPGVCSEEYVKELNASTDHPEITTVANTTGFQEAVPFEMYAVGATVFLIMIVIVFIFVFWRCRKKKNGIVPIEMDNIQGPGTQPTEHGRGALPSIPTITADPSIHQSPVPSHVAQTNRQMTQRNQDRIPLQSLVSPVDDTVERDQNRTMGARSNAGTKVKTVPMNPDVQYAVVNKKPRSGKFRADKHKLDLEVSSASRGPLDPSVEYATVDKQRNISANPCSSSAQLGLLDLSLDYATVSERVTDVTADQNMRGPRDPSVEYATVNKERNISANLGSSSAQLGLLDLSMDYATVNERITDVNAEQNMRGPLDPSVEYATVNKQRNISSNPGSSSAQLGLLDLSLDYATVNERVTDLTAQQNMRGPLDPSVEYATVDKQRNISSTLGSSSAQLGLLDLSMDYATVNERVTDVTADQNMLGLLDLSLDYATVNERVTDVTADQNMRGPLDPSVEYAAVNKQRNISSNPGSSSAQKGDVVQQEQSLRKEIGRRGNVPHVYTASASGLAEYAVVDTTREERKKGQPRAHQMNMAYHDPEEDYAVIDKRKKSRREKGYEKK